MAGRVKTVVKLLPLCSDSLWAMVSQHPTRASPSEEIVTGVMWVLENDDLLKGLLLLYCSVAILHSNAPCEDTLLCRPG